MLRNMLIILALVTGIFCFGMILSADSGRHNVEINAPGFIIATFDTVSYDD